MTTYPIFPSSRQCMACNGSTIKSLSKQMDGGWMDGQMNDGQVNEKMKQSRSVRQENVRGTAA